MILNKKFRTRLAISDPTKHESPKDLLGQCTNGTVVPQFKIGMDTRNGLLIGSGSKTKYQLLPDGLLQLATTSST